MKFLVHYGQIRNSERRVIYRNAIPVNAADADSAAIAVSRTFGIRTEECDWVIIEIEEFDNG